MLLPVLMNFKIRKNHVFGNEFIYNSDEEVIGFNINNPLASENGKVKILETISLKGEVHVIGDGYNDYLLKKSGKVSAFMLLLKTYIGKRSVMWRIKF